MAKVMMNIKLTQPLPTVEKLQGMLGLQPGQIDAAFGVIEVDPEQHICTILVDESFAGYRTADPKLGLEGPYSNPKIGTFGPPQK